MAFLATVMRFGPDLDKHRQGEPNPCTYTPANDALAVKTGKHASGTFGYHRSEQLEQPSKFVAAAASSPAIAATLKALGEKSLQCMRETSMPNPCTYSPVVEGQFRRVYTTKDIQAERKRSARQRQPVKNRDCMSAQELHLSLGPGSYEVKHDTNQDMVATPFTFTHEKRHNILDNTAALGRVGFSPGPALYRIDSSTAVPAVTIANAPFRSKHAAAFITRVRSDSQLHQQEQRNVASYSKQLAKSYQELDVSVQRLEKRLASPEIREHTLQRFDKDITELEAYRRGPGSYDCACACGKKTSSSKANDGGYENSEAVSCIRTGCFQQSPLPSIRHKQSSSFGRVASRDLLTSMIAAGHASGHTIGPGVYDAYSSSVILQTHNLGYKQEMKRTESKAKRQIRVGSADRDEDIRAGPKLSHKEMWKIMKQGPTLLS